MIPQHIKVVDFMAYREATVPLEGIKLACLYGDNGAGKSTLIDAITWALWGKARAKSDDDIVRQGAGSASVDLYFLSSGVEYHVARTRKVSTKTGQSTLSFERVKSMRNGEVEDLSRNPFSDLTGATIKDTQQMIDTTLRMSYSTFCNSAYLRQGHSDEFTIRPPGERKAVLGEILDLEEYQRLEAIAREKGRTLRWELEKIQVALDGIGVDLDDQIKDALFAIGSLTSQRTELQTKIPGMRAKLNELRDVRAKAEAALEALNEAKRGRETAEANRKGAQVDVLGYEGQQAQLNKLIGQAGVIEQRYAEFGKAEEELAAMDGKLAELHNTERAKAELEWAIQEERSTLESRLATVQQKHKSLEPKAPGVCPTCGQQMPAEVNELVTQAYDKAKSEALILSKQLGNENFRHKERTDLLVALKEIACLQVDTKDMPALKNKLNELKGCDFQVSQLEDARERLPGIDKLLSQKREQVTKHEGHILLYDTKIKDIENRLTGTMDFDQKIDGLYWELERYQDRDRELGDEHARLEAKVEHMKEQIEHMVKLQSTKQQLVSQVSDYEDLTNAFGKTGVQALIIETAIPAIEVEANRLLGNMSAGRMSLALETQRATKTDTIRETLDIEISDELGTRPYECFSGGEAFRINLALRIAMSRLLANRAGAPLPTLIIDEGFGSLDQDGLSSVISCLHTAQDEFDLVLVITHLESLREQFPTQIRVRKEPTGSVVSVQ